MYTTKPLSLFKSHPEVAAESPPEGGNAGYLIMKSATDEEDDETTCWGTSRRVLELPFPQNRVLRVEYGVGDNSTYQENVVFVPVPDQPLASNRYYIVVAMGKHKGLVMACSREEDMTMCCFCQCISDMEPRPFDPTDVYQQIEIVQHRRGLFTARAVAADGFPSFMFRSKPWDVYESKKIVLGEAPGLDAALRSRQLAAAFPAAATTAAVGKWYCPFFLVKEQGVPRWEQMARSAFYEVVLEQRWKPVRGDDTVRHAHYDGSKLASKKVLIGGSVEAKPDAGRSRHGDAYMWFVAATGQRVGCCGRRLMAGGWTVDEKEPPGSMADGSVLLVERFMVKRTDSSVVVAFDFMHTIP
ncbi:hypothetical protein PAHAL_6G193400 [Panicum hallii]|uniref:Uncharacterized protein n=1 Tax=Panicum hallii TaxID=206008 RepID=A0A2T8IGT5_9POAL|nr:hypothetical protein PAHAL_6G193400 [Panicum hallii]